jgi:hypothetical protein
MLYVPMFNFTITCLGGCIVNESHENRNEARQSTKVSGKPEIVSSANDELEGMNRLPAAESTSADDRQRRGFGTEGRASESFSIVIALIRAQMLWQAGPTWTERCKVSLSCRVFSLNPVIQTFALTSLKSINKRNFDSFDTSGSMPNSWDNR